MTFKQFVNSMLKRGSFDPHTANHETHEELHNKLLDASHEHSDIDKRHLQYYTDSSSGLNRALVAANPSETSNRSKLAHDAIMRHAKPVGHEYHTFSGTDLNIQKICSDVGRNIFHSPAHISTTHDYDVAERFAGRRNEDPLVKHIIHIKTKPSDKAIYAGGFSSFPEERETIFPAGTNLEYHGTSKHEKKGVTINIHHCSVHSQEHDKVFHSNLHVGPMNHAIDHNDTDDDGIHSFARKIYHTARHDAKSSEAVRDATIGAKLPSLNDTLLRGQSLTPKDGILHDRLLSAAKPTDIEHHLFTTHSPYHEHPVNGSKLSTPIHILASADHNGAVRKADESESEVAHYHIKKGDKIVSTPSGGIIPAGTNLVYRGHSHYNDFGTHVKVHHYTLED